MPLLADTWLTNLLGVPAFNLGGAPRDLSADQLPDAPAFVAVKVSVDDVTSLVHLQNVGFRVIDTNVQLRRAAALIDCAPEAMKCVRFARPEDAEGVRALAGREFEYDRFHRDPDIGHEVAARIKEEWAGNFFNGRRGEWMVVAVDQDRICGFAQLLRGAGDAVIIDLIAVARESRGKGLAKAMIAYAGHECLGRAAPMIVGTQIANIPSLSLYTALGFRVHSAAYVLHLHRKN